MKALVTAGGKGTRLRPITHTLNKHLVPICNKPLLFWALDHLSTCGITDVIVNINKGDTEIRRELAEGKPWGMDIQFIEQDEPKGLGHVLSLAEPFLRDDKFVFYYGDNVLTGGLQRYMDQFISSQANCHLCLVRVDNPQDFGVAVTEQDRIVQTIEKPQKHVSDLAITGIQFYDSTIFEAIKHIKPTPPIPPRTIAEMDIPPANQWLIDNGYKVTYSEITGWWKDTGKPEDLLEASRLLLDKIQKKILSKPDKNTVIEGRVVIESDTSISNCHVRGPVMIGRNCVLKNSYIGPFTSIDSGSQIIDTEIEHSIVLSNVYIDNIKPRIEGSIIGQNARIQQAKTIPQAHNLMIGDHSQVYLV